MTLARTKHELADQTVRLNLKSKPYQMLEDGVEFHVEDWWENVAGMSWMVARGNPACLGYAMRAGFGDIPTDNEVVYGKVGALGYLVHVSELGEVQS